MSSSNMSDQDHIDYDNIAKAVGRALDLWSQIEWHLAQVFQHLSEIPNAEKAQAVFSAIVSFDGRLKMCTELMRLGDLSEMHKTYWHGLHNRLAKKALKRNELAHFTIAHVVFLNGERLWALVPYFSLDKLNKAKVGAPFVRLLPRDIDERREQFGKLSRELIWVLGEIQLARGVVVANPAQEPERIRQLRNESD